LFQKATAAFQEYYDQHFKEAMMDGTIVPIVPVVCTQPIKYQGERAVQRDIDNVKATAKAAGIDDDPVALPATAPSGVGMNEFYKTDEEYFHAVADALNEEYRAIISSGIFLQVGDPFLPDIFMEPDLDQAQMKQRAEIYVEATNAAVKGIPAERVRFHTCYRVNEGPRLYEAAADIVQYFLKSTPNPTASMRKPRHEHE
jgi:5-methyltetrahydropteroyltriglutamate--homocysteine methyltransferase